MQEPDELTTTAGAQRLRMDPSRLRRLIRDGRIPARREETPRGPVLYVRIADLDAWQPGPVGRPRKQVSPAS